MTSGYEPIGTDSGSDPKTKKVAIGSAIAALLVGIIAYLKPSGSIQSYAERSVTAPPVKLYDETNRFVMEDYDAKPAFADFLPGVAGLYGKPVWAFYVNRGQGISSFGTESKKFPMLEFNAANKAYQLTPYIGFRTFIKAKRGDKEFVYEPFSPRNTRIPGEADEESKPKRFMYVGTNEMEVKEISEEHGLTVNSTYIVLPMEKFSSLVRKTTFTNDGDVPLELSSLDGVATFEPDGGDLDWDLKNMGRTLEGWMEVKHADDSITMPYYKLSTEPGDTADVHIELGGHYCLSFVVPEDDSVAATLLPIAYDPRKIFGWDTSYTEPSGLVVKSVTDIVNDAQYGDAKTSSAFSALETTVLPPGESITLATFYGKTDAIENVPKIADTVTAPGYITEKFSEARSFIDKTLSGVETNSSVKLFDGAVKQMFLDNSLRGGLAQVMGDVDDSKLHLNYDEDSSVKIFHVYSRIHGDLERDYNQFDIKPSYFSQGPGNYRDVAQNRRSDVFFVPRLASFNVEMFLSFIQADGYEPLTVEAVAFSISDEEVAEELASKLTDDERSHNILRAVLLGGPVRPGQLFELVAQLDIVLSVDNPTFINSIIGAANQTAMGVYKTGYWADHWEYYLDLIESYTAMYPDGEESMLFDKQLRYFYSPASVKPRGEKYTVTLTFDASANHILQLESTGIDPEKEQQQRDYLNSKTGRIGVDANWQTSEDGEFFFSTPIAKLFLLGTIKFATRDAYGMGVEYEGGRPGWNDAMNGLPGMVGSGMPETFELQQLLLYVNSALSKYDRPIVIPAELKELIDTIQTELGQLLSSGYQDSEGDEVPADVPEVMFKYWDNVATARESYRLKTKLHFSGATYELSAVDARSILSAWLEQVELGIARSLKVGSYGDGDDGKSGIPPSYFSYDVTSWNLNGGSNSVGLPTADPLSMKVGSFPLFLEGPVRYMKVIIDDQEAQKELYEKVKSSGLRDTELNMYFLSASLKGQSYDMGRMMAFTPGWLENQSIWMHMSYKYYLQLLRGGLYDEFFSEMRGGGMLPFMDPTRYGRSLMQCSSFLASSAFPDPSQHGRGFSARLSGSTAEFLNMWRIMYYGHKPFFLDQGSLKFRLEPVLPQWMFVDETAEDYEIALTEPASVSFKLFAAIDVTYHVDAPKDLYAASPKKYVIHFTDGTSKSVDGPVLDTVDADAVRRVISVQSIDVYF